MAPMARATAGGAVVSDDGNWYWTGLRWQPLTSNPSTKAPGLLSKERRDLAAVVKGRSVGEMGRAGAVLAEQMRSGGASVGNAEAAMNPVQVKQYKDAREYERDAIAMGAAGWTPQGQVAQESRLAAGKTLGKAVATGGIGLLLTGRAKKGGGITVTWVRKEPAVAAAQVGGVAEQLRELADLHAQGIVTDAEFEAKKAELLARM